MINSTVRVTEGVYAGCRATVRRIDEAKRRMRVLIEIRDCIVGDDLNFSQVELA